MGLFALEDFVLVSGDIDIAESVENDERDAVETDDRMEIELLPTGNPSLNGHHPDDATDE